MGLDRVRIGWRSLVMVVLAALAALGTPGCNDDLLNHEAEIESIYFVKHHGQDTMLMVSDTIRPQSTSITLTVSHMADLQQLVPVFKLSNGAKASCQSGQAYDFSKPFDITITAANGRNRRTYRFEVRRLAPPPTIPPVEPDLNGDSYLTNFRLEGLQAKITVKGTRIYAEVPEGTDITKLVPRFDLPKGATVEYEQGTPYDFTEPLYLRITSEDKANVTTYRVFVRYPDPVLSPEAQIYSFRFYESDEYAEIDGSRIYASVRPGSDLSKLTPTFRIPSGATASVLPQVAADYTKPVTIEVTSQDKSAKSVYTVYAEPKLQSRVGLEELLLLPCGEPTFRDDRSFTFLARNREDISQLKVFLRLAHGCTSNLENGKVYDFTSPQTLTLTSEDGYQQRSYTITVTVVDGDVPDEKGTIISWEFAGVVTRTEIVRNRIYCHVPPNTDITALTPVFLFKESEGWWNLSKGHLFKEPFKSSDEIESEKATLDFSEPRQFEVWRKNPWAWEVKARSRYTVYVTVDQAREGEADLISFGLKGVQGAHVKRRGARVDITVPNETDVRSLIPEYRISLGATTNLAQGVATDFSHEVKMLVTSQGGGVKREYTIRVERRLSDQAELRNFRFREISGEPVLSGSTYTAYAGPEVNLAQLTPEFQVVRGARCSLQSGVPGDFRKPVQFDVVSEDGSITRRYTVVVEQHLNSEAELLEFRFRELDAPCEISGNRVMIPELPNGVSLTALTPEYRVSSGAKCTLAHGVTADFSTGKRFTVTSEDGSRSKSYVVKRQMPSIRFDFEQWITIGSGKTAYQQPEGAWSSGNAGTAIAIAFYGRPERFPTRKTNDAHSGNAAALVSTELLNVDGNSIAAGSLWLGGFKGDNVRKDPLSGPQFGTVWAGGRPDMFRGWYKYKPGAQMVNKAGEHIEGTDELAIYAVLFHGPRLTGHNINSSPEIVCIAKLGDLKAKSEYTYFEVAFEECNGGIRPGEPLQYTIVLSSSRDGGNFVGAVGSELTVDDLEITLK